MNKTDYIQLNKCNSNNNYYNISICGQLLVKFNARTLKSPESGPAILEVFSGKNNC